MCATRLSPPFALTSVLPMSPEAINSLGILVFHTHHSATCVLAVATKEAAISATPLISPTSSHVPRWPKPCRRVPHHSSEFPLSLLASRRVLPLDLPIPSLDSLFRSLCLEVEAIFSKSGHRPSLPDSTTTGDPPPSSTHHLHPRVTFYAMLPSPSPELC